MGIAQSQPQPQLFSQTPKTTSPTPPSQPPPPQPPAPQPQVQAQVPRQQGKWKVSDVANRDNVTVSSIFVTINPNREAVTMEEFRPFIQSITGIADKLITFKGGKEPLPNPESAAWSDTPKIEYALEVGPQKKLNHAHLLFTMKPYSKYGYVHVNVNEIKRLGERYFGWNIYVNAKSIGEPTGLYNYLSKTRPDKSFSK